MQAIRQIHDSIASKISIPKELQHRKVEVILLPLDNQSEEANNAAHGKKWPDKFFELTAGCLADDPIQRASQGDYETRDPLK